MVMDCRRCDEAKRETCSFVKFSWDFDGDRLQGCPFDMLNHSTVIMFRIFSYWEKGLFPDEGTWMDQSAKIVDAMEVIEKEIADARAEEHKTLMRKNRKGR